MHPAYSVILFTTASGAGYGLLFWLSLFHLAGVVPLEGWRAPVALLIALTLITVGLLSSTFHLGHPERAWRALSQWRSSWLSREGVAAVATYVPAGALLLLALLQPQSQVALTLSTLAALGAAGAVYCTAMIYSSLRTVAQWNHPLVPLIYLTLAAASGLLLLALTVAPPASLECAFLGVIAAGGLKQVYWRTIDQMEPRFTAAQALGLGADGIRQLDPPHTQPNFVMREMGYEIARRHVLRLRRLSLLTLSVLPAFCLALGALIGAPMVFAGLATISMAVGLVTERWLFFAEASHVSMLYYGKAQA